MMIAEQLKKAIKGILNQYDIEKKSKGSMEDELYDFIADVQQQSYLCGLEDRKWHNVKTVEVIEEDGKPKLPS